MRKKVRRERLLKLAKKIEKHENKFHMGSWFDADNLNLPEEKVIEKVIEARRPICKTTACAAGWAVFMFGTKKQIRNCIREKNDWSLAAQDLLGMTDQEATIFGATASGARDIAFDLREMAGPA